MYQFGIQWINFICLWPTLASLSVMHRGSGDDARGISGEYAETWESHAHQGLCSVISLVTRSLIVMSARCVTQWGVICVSNHLTEILQLPLCWPDICRRLWSILSSRSPLLSIINTLYSGVWSQAGLFVVTSLLQESIPGFTGANH